MRNLLDPLDARPVSYAIADDPARVGLPNDDCYEDCSPQFDELSDRQQLDAIQRLSQHSEFYSRVLRDFNLDNPEAERQVLGMTVDSAVTDADLGRTLREKVVQYFARVAEARGEDLAEVIP